MAKARRPICLFLCGLPALIGGDFAAHAAGFAIREQSATAQGNSFAGASAAADDISYMFFNPASLAMLDGTRVEAVTSLILPRADFEIDSATTVGGVPISGGGDQGGSLAAVPALYAMVSPSARLRLGLAVTAPFGLRTDYDDDYAGRYHGTFSELRTININPTVAYKLSERVALAAGLVAEYAKSELENAIDFRTIAGLGLPNGSAAQTAQFNAPEDDGAAAVEGDDWGFGFTLGALIEPFEGTRLGLAYRSRVEHTLDGDADFTLSTTGQAVAANSGNTLFQDSAAQASFETPQSVSFGIAQQVTPRLTLLGEVAWTDWSSFDELRIEFDSAQPDNVTTEEWQDSFFIALGATYRLNERLTLRGGVAFDEQAVPGPERRTPRIPDADRYWVSVGLGYAHGDWLKLDAGYSHIFVPHNEVDLTTADDSNNIPRGNLQGEFNSNVNILAFSFRVRF